MRCKNCGAPDPGHTCRYCRTRRGYKPPFGIETAYGVRPLDWTGGEIMQFLVGERGPELVTLPRPTSINPGKSAWR